MPFGAVDCSTTVGSGEVRKTLFPSSFVSRLQVPMPICGGNKVLGVMNWHTLMHLRFKGLRRTPQPSLNPSLSRPLPSQLIISNGFERHFALKTYMYISILLYYILFRLGHPHILHPPNPSYSPHPAHYIYSPVAPIPRTHALFSMYCFQGICGFIGGIFYVLFIRFPATV